MILLLWIGQKHVKLIFITPIELCIVLQVNSNGLGDVLELGLVCQISRNFDELA